MAAVKENIFYRCGVCKLENFSGRWYRCLACVPLVDVCPSCYQRDYYTAKHKELHPVRFMLSPAMKKLYFSGERYPFDVPQSLRCILCKIGGLSTVEFCLHMRETHCLDYSFLDYLPAPIVHYKAQCDREVLAAYKSQALLRNAAINRERENTLIFQLLPLQLNGEFVNDNTSMAVRKKELTALPKNNYCECSLLGDAHYTVLDEAENVDALSLTDDDYDSEQDHSLGEEDCCSDCSHCSYHSYEKQAYMPNTPPLMARKDIQLHAEQKNAMLVSQDLTNAKQIVPIPTAAVQSDAEEETQAAEKHTFLLKKFLIEPPAEHNPEIQHQRAEITSAFLMITMRSLS